MKAFSHTALSENRRPNLSRWAIFALLAVFAMVLLVLALAPASASAPPEAGTNVAPAFSTPEDAVRHFCEALAANDFEMAMEACAVREQAVGFDFPGYVDRLKVHMPLLNPAPSTSGLYQDLNTATVLGNFANQMKMLIYSFFVSDGMDGKPVTPADRAYAEVFEKAVDAEKLANLKLLRVDPPMKSILESGKNIENFTKMAKLHGAEEMTERIVLYELDGQTFLGGFVCYRYASGWKIFRLGSSLAGLSATGAAEAVTIQDYVEIL